MKGAFKTFFAQICDYFNFEFSYIPYISQYFSHYMLIPYFQDYAFCTNISHIL